MLLVRKEIVSVLPVRSMSLQFPAYLSRSLLLFRFASLGSLICVLGCGADGNSNAPSRTNQTQFANAPLYIVDGIAEQYHSSSFSLRNETDTPKTYNFLGVSCGCLACKQAGKSLNKGDKILVAPRGIAEITCTNRLAYIEGFYCNNAYFEEVDAPAHPFEFRSPYGVLKRLRISPGALVFERDGGEGVFKATAEVKFRQSEVMHGHLVIDNNPSSIRWQPERKAEASEQRMSAGSQTFYEDDWKITFTIAPDAIDASKIPPDGEIVISVLDEQGKRLAIQSFPYNAEGFFKQLPQ